MNALSRGSRTRPRFTLPNLAMSIRPTTRLAGIGALTMCVAACASAGPGPRAGAQPSPTMEHAPAPFQLYHAAGRPLVVSMEMFERDVQLAVDEYLAGLISEEQFLASARPWANYERDYRPLVELAREEGLPVVAAMAHAIHLAIEGEASKARAAADGAGRPLVVHLTGSFHVENRTGAPEALRHYRPGARDLVITTRAAADPADFEGATRDLDVERLADLILLTPAGAGAGDPARSPRDRP